jgi:hypothetical protein
MDVLKKSNEDEKSLFDSMLSLIEDSTGEGGVVDVGAARQALIDRGEELEPAYEEKDMIVAFEKAYDLAETNDVHPDFVKVAIWYSKEIREPTDIQQWTLDLTRINTLAKKIETLSEVPNIFQGGFMRGGARTRLVPKMSERWDFIRQHSTAFSRLYATYDEEVNEYLKSTEPAKEGPAIDPEEFEETTRQGIERQENEGWSSYIMQGGQKKKRNPGLPTRTERLTEIREKLDDNELSEDARTELEEALASMTNAGGSTEEEQPKPDEDYDPPQPRTTMPAFGGKRKPIRSLTKKGQKVLELYSEVQKFLGSIFDFLTQSDLPSSALGTEAVKDKAQREAEERRTKKGKSSQKISKMLTAYSSGDAKTAADILEKISTQDLMNIQRFFLNGKQPLMKALKVVLVPSDSKWNEDKKNWSKYIMYNGKTSEDVFRGVLVRNKKKLLSSRKSQGQLLSELEDFESAEYEKLVSSSKLRGTEVGVGKVSMSELTEEVKDYIEGTDKIIPLDGSNARTYRKLLIRTIEKIRVQDSDKDTSELEESIRIVEFIYAVLKHMGKASSINLNMFDSVKEISNEQKVSFDLNRDFNLPDLSAATSTEGDAE